jgi:hypothetical protein
MTAKATSQELRLEHQNLAVDIRGFCVKANED